MVGKVFIRGTLRVKSWFDTSYGIVLVAGRGFLSILYFYFSGWVVTGMPCYSLGLARVLGGSGLDRENLRDLPRL